MENSLSDEQKAIQQYKDGLSLGYTKGIKEIYQAAGVSFDFSAQNMKSLAEITLNYLTNL